MRTLFSYSRYLVLVAVVGLMIAALAIFVFGGITTITTVVDVFTHGEFNAEGSRLLSVEVIELIDLFLLGTVLLITAIGLYQLFMDPGIPLPAWLSVTNIEQLKFNLLAVVLVMLAILFLGAAAGEWPEGTTILEYGAAIALVIAALSAAVWVFGRIHHQVEETKHAELAETESHAEAHTAGHGSPETPAH